MRVNFLLPEPYGYENGKVEISHVSLPDISRSGALWFFEFRMFHVGGRQHDLSLGARNKKPYHTYYLQFSQSTGKARSPKFPQPSLAY